MLRATILTLFCVAALSLSACAVLTKSSATETSQATERTAYLNCGGCHGDQNVQVDFMAPKIIGQKKGYLATKMRDFRDMKRIHPKMNGVLSGMSDQDIAQLAAYYANYKKNKI